MAVEKFAEKTVREYTELTAAVDGKPALGGAAAVTAALAASLGLLAGRVTGEAAEKTSADLETLRIYMLHLCDEDIKASAPMAKYSASDRTVEENEAHYQACLRLSCSIPNEIMYKTAECAERLGWLAQNGAEEALGELGAALCLCRAAMSAVKYLCMARSKEMADEVFAMTIRREIEMVFAEAMPKLDAALAVIEQRLALA